MKLLFLCKRFPQQRDLIERPHGRFHHLPAELALLGHEVHVSLCSHRRLPSTERVSAGVTWSSHDAIGLGPRRLLQVLESEASSFRPDWVIGCSDAWYGWLARRIAAACGANMAVDAYDNYEAYMPWNAPLHWAWRRAVRSADLVTCAGPQLAVLLKQHRSPEALDVEIIPMAADPAFVALERTACRNALGLPLDTPLIGYSGAWARNRGTHAILEAFRRLRRNSSDARLVLSGRPPAAACSAPGVMALGYLDDSALPVLVNAIDVACVITANTSFGRFSYPAKLCEAMACGTPVVATATPPVAWMLGNRRQHLAEVGDAEAIAEGLLSNLVMIRVNYGPLPSWPENAKKLHTLLGGG